MNIELPRRCWYHICIDSLAIKKTTYRVSREKTLEKYIFVNLLSMDHAKELREKIKNSNYGLANHHPNPDRN
jgi:vacuolar-type H+-ATPase subunit C/Vma6